LNDISYILSLSAKVYLATKEETNESK
jgi:hypothetical protein